MLKIHGFLRGWLSPQKRSTVLLDLFRSPGDDILVREALGPEDITKMLRILGSVRQVVRSALRSVMGKSKGKPTTPNKALLNLIKVLVNLANHHNYVVRPYFLGGVALRGVTLRFP